MDYFKETIKQLSSRVEQLKSSLHTEEATKAALVLPFLQALGFDVFNPQEVAPEYIKNGEKIDYAIISKGEPVIFVRCKHWKQELTWHDELTIRYLYEPDVKYCILTNGIVYRFYLVLSEEHKIDEKPFLKVNLSWPESFATEELYKFHRCNFDIDNVRSVAYEMKYTQELKNLVRQEFARPTPELALLFARRVYGGIITPEILRQFTEYLNTAISGFMSDMIMERFNTALSTESDARKRDKQQAEEPLLSLNDKIIASKEEMEGFLIVRTILGEVVLAERIVYRDAVNYFAVLLDDDDRKPVCRFYFTGGKKYIATFGREKTETRNYMESLDDIYDYSAQLKDIVRHYLECGSRHVLDRDTGENPGNHYTLEEQEL